MSRTLTPSEFVRVERNLLLVHDALSKDALGYLEEYVETLQRLAISARDIRLERAQLVTGDNIRERLEFAAAVLSARRVAVR